MGVYIYQVTCTACDFRGTAREGISSYSYLLPDGATAPLTADCAWCNNCRAVVDAERIRPQAEMEPSPPSTPHAGCGGTLQFAMLAHASGTPETLHSVEGLPIHSL
ncbi:MAG: hypothetical protein IPK82_30055 [Polyangiaceae bacterium]|nr:hypothetical protein [Polyangiaceae bacterium]